MNTSAFSRIDPVTLIEKLTPGLEDRGNLILTLRHLAEVAQQIFAADICAVEMFHPFTRELIHFFTLSPDNSILPDQASLEDLLLALNQQDLILVTRAEEYPEYQNALTMAWQIQSFVAFALRIRPGTQPVGVLYLAFRRPLTFQPTDYDLLPFFARQTSFVLQDTWLLHCYREVARIGQEINQGLSTPDALFQKLHTMVPSILDVSHALLLSIHYAPLNVRNLYIVDEGSYQYIRDRPFAGVSRYVFDTRQSTLIHHWSKEAVDAPFCIAPIAGTRPKESYIFVPMILRDVPLGVLSIQHPRPNTYTEEDRVLLQMLANQIALALTNMQAFESVSQRHIRELELVQEIDQEINRSLELGPILNTLLQRAAERVSAESGSILLADERNEVLKAQAVWGKFTNKRAKLRKNLHNPAGITGWVFKHQSAARVANVHTNKPWCERYFEISPEIISELDIPLMEDDKAIGVLNLESSKENAFSREDQVFLETLATQAVLAITRAQDYEHRNRLAREQRVLNEISKEIVSQLDLKSVFDQILIRALALTKSQNGVLMLYNPEKNLLWMAAERGVIPEKRGLPHRLDEGVVGYVASTKRPLNVDPSQTPWSEYYLNYIPDTRSELAVPILAGEKLLGVLNVESVEERAFDESDQRLIQGLSDLAAVALRNAEFYQKAEEEALYFQLLYQAGQELSEINDPKQLELGYEVIARLAEQQNQSAVVLRRYEESTGDLVLKKSIFHRPRTDFAPRIGSNEGVSGYVTRNRCTWVINDLSNPALLPPGVEAPILGNSMLCSLLVIPIQFKERYYGTLSLGHEEIGHFRGRNITFYEGMAQQLAGTIYRLETLQARLAAEELSLIGESAMELTHFLANQLGLVESYAGNIRRRIAERLGRDNAIESKLENIITSVRRVLQWSRELKEQLRNPHETDIDVPVLISPETLFSNAWNVYPRPEHIHLEMDVYPEVTNVYVSEKLVGYILQNLIKNAIEAMETGGTLTLRAYAKGNRIALAVEDTGEGIPLVQREHIFDLFHSTKKSSGYGLWSARRNATRVHGSLHVDSLPGHGATFTLLLPRENRNRET